MNAGNQNHPLYTKYFIPFRINLSQTCLQKKSFENTVEKGGIARNEQFLPSPVFSTLLENFLPYSSDLKLSSANSVSLEESKICRLGKG